MINVKLVRDRNGHLDHRLFEVNGETFKVPPYARDLREWMAACCVGITQAQAGGDVEKLKALSEEVRRLRTVLDN
jgi:hypothetical protein